MLRLLLRLFPLLILLNTLRLQFILESIFWPLFGFRLFLLLLLCGYWLLVGRLGLTPCSWFVLRAFGFFGVIQGWCLLLRGGSLGSFVLAFVVVLVLSSLFMITICSVAALTTTAASASLAAAPRASRLRPSPALSLLVSLVVLISRFALPGLPHCLEYLIGSRVVTFVSTCILWLQLFG